MKELSPPKDAHVRHARPSAGPSTGPANLNLLIESLYAQLYDALYRRALGATGSLFDADDLVQEAFYRLLRRVREQPATQVDHRYVARVLDNIIRNWYRDASSARSHQARYHREQSIHPLVEDPDVVCRMRLIQDIVAQAIDELPARCRQAVMLVRIEGRRLDDAAHRMGISINTLQEQLRLARERLRTWFLMRGIRDLSDL